MASTAYSRTHMAGTTPVFPALSLLSVQYATIAGEEPGTRLVDSSLAHEGMAADATPSLASTYI